MLNDWLVYCETADLAAEAAAIGQALGMPIRPELSSVPLDAAARLSSQGTLALALMLKAPPAHDLVEAQAIAQAYVGKLLLGICEDGDRTARGLAHDLGIACLLDVPASLSAMALVHFAGTRPLRLLGRKLSALDRMRIGDGLLGGGEKGAGRLATLSPTRIGFEAQGTPSVSLGMAAEVRAAIEAIRASEPLTDPPAPEIANRHADAAREVLFGPTRLLSDPASKAALTTYGLPLPQEELCSSPSRAASEATRIGFPVRISLASPDLRVWDHPELSVDGVDNAARVRDVYRQLLLAAEAKQPSARVLGVTVTATTLARALIRIQARPLPLGKVLLRLGFADPHGIVARDVTQTVHPAGARAIERALRRMRGSALLLGDANDERQRNLTAISQLLAQVGYFVDDLRAEVARIDLNPVALLLGGGTEVREAAVHVTDAFTNGLA
jgi:hypothetical protein